MILGVLFILAAPLLAQQIPIERLKPLFDYDASRPLDARAIHRGGKPPIPEK